METHMPCVITQCYLPPDGVDVPAFTTASWSWYTRFRDPRLMQGWVDLVEVVYLAEDAVIIPVLTGST